MANSCGVHTLAHVDKEKGRKRKIILSEEKEKQCSRVGNMALFVHT